ncbi:MAG: hypothetical protein ACE5JO_01310 [Candidatus Binatia bacterium]
MNYIALGFIALGSIIHWLLGKLWMDLRLLDPMIRSYPDQLLLERLPAIFILRPGLAMAILRLPFILWGIGIVFGFLHSLKLGLVLLPVVIVLWVFLSPQPIYKRYPEEEISQLICSLALRQGMVIEPEAAQMLAKCCDGSPGKASALVEKVKNYSSARHIVLVTTEVAREALGSFGYLR